jgi:hypothetical protein
MLVLVPGGHWLEAVKATKDVMVVKASASASQWCAALVKHRILGSAIPTGSQTCDPTLQKFYAAVNKADLKATMGRLSDEMEQQIKDELAATEPDSHLDWATIFTRAADIARQPVSVARLLALVLGLAWPLSDDEVAVQAKDYVPDCKKVLSGLAMVLHDAPDMDDETIVDKYFSFQEVNVSTSKRLLSNRFSMQHSLTLTGLVVDYIHALPLHAVPLTSAQVTQMREVELDCNRPRDWFDSVMRIAGGPVHQPFIERLARLRGYKGMVNRAPHAVVFVPTDGSKELPELLCHREVRLRLGDC